MFALSKKRILVNDSLKLCFYRNLIKKVESILFLGIILPETLSWKPYALAILQKTRRNIGILFQLISYLKTNNLINIFFFQYYVTCATALRLRITEIKHLPNILNT